MADQPAPIHDWNDALQRVTQGSIDASFTEVTRDVARLGVIFVNVYAVGTPENWILLDTGLPGAAGVIEKACAERFGPDSRPAAIVLTHAHFDHAGNVAELARRWGVPVYVHERELPYVTGVADYPPQDPTPGGAICFLSRFFPHSGYDLPRRGVDVRPLDGDGGVPGLRDWHWIHTPGHTAGHVSLFRESDGVLLAGDAFATMDLDSWPEQIKRTRELHRPPTPFTPDWQSTRQSIHALAELRPMTVAAGHGLPMSGRTIADELWKLAANVQGPPDGRYTHRPATYNAAGAPRSVPPAHDDPLRRMLLIGGGIAAGLLALTGLAASLARRRVS